MSSGLTENIRLYFANDHRYQNEGRIGEGAFGCVFKIKDTQAQDGSPPRVALKVPFSKEFALGGDRYMSEIAALDALRGALHVVNRIRITEDPLRRRVQGADEITSDWIYLEYLENGTFRQFYKRLMILQKSAPNRLIWPIVLCLFRICMALAWPNSYASDMTRMEEPEEHNPMYIITNPDLHDDNMMFGDLAADGSLEHQMVPILKMIDMGECQRERTRSEQDWLEKTSDLIVAVIADHIWTLCERGARTSANDVPLDPELEVLASISRMEQVDIRRVSAVVMDAVATRTESWYQREHPDLDAGIESNSSVQDLVRSVFFDADGTFTTIF